MNFDVTRGGWDWVDVTDLNELDRSKAYLIEIGRQYWQLKYRGLNEWVCFRKANDPELSANELIEAGCHVYVKRDPIRFDGLCRVVRVNGQIIISGLDGVIPDSLFDGLVSLTLVENNDVFDSLGQSRNYEPSLSA